MTDTVPSEVYPFATQDGKAIPLDIIKPSGIITKTFTLAAASFTIPAGYKVGTFLATVGCLVRFGATLPNPLVDATLYEDTLLVPNDTIVTSSILSTTVYVKGLAESGTLYVQLIEKWIGLALDKQFTRK